MAERVKLIQKLARYGASIPMFLLIIAIWSFFILKAAEPTIDDATHSLIRGTKTNCANKLQPECTGNNMCIWTGHACENACDHISNAQQGQGDETACNNHKSCKWNPDSLPGSRCSEDLSFHPVDVFCQAQEVNVGQTAVTQTQTTSAEQAQTGTPCADSSHVRYNCGSLGTISYGGSSRTLNINESGFCPSGKYPDTAQTWCDDQNINTSSGTNLPLLVDRAKLNCCKEHIYESNINYFGLITYFIITIPIVYSLIEKIVVVFIKYKEGAKVDGDQFQVLGEYLSKNFGKYVAMFIGIYYILLPFLRFLIVSYKCEDQHSHASQNCGKSCTNDVDCATLHGNSSCSMCINNICDNPHFHEQGGGAAQANVNISLCGLRSMLNDLSDDEIDKLYQKYKSPSASANDKAAKIQEIDTQLSSDANKHRNATEEFLKFFPRQQIAINDTSTPFNVSIPNPTSYNLGGTTTQLSGFNYRLNNYIHLEDYEPPSPITACHDISTENECNKNHNCKFDGSTCTDSYCKDYNNADITTNGRYSLPPISGINATQDLSDLSLHNKVIRSGLDIPPNGDSNSNLYPCNDVVISLYQKAAAKSSIQQSRTLSSTADDTWITNFELARVECSDKNGQCYLDDYICKTKSGVPIPLEYLGVPIQGAYTIGEVSDEGCKTAMYPCSPGSDPSNPPSCTALVYNSDTGYLLEKADGGKCLPTMWNSSSQGWITPPAGTDPSLIKNMCVPTNASYNNNPLPTAGTPSITDAKAGSWLSNINTPGSSITTQCKAVKRIPNSSVQDSSNNNPYYRWNPTAMSGQLLCSDQPDSICTSTSPPKIKNNLATTTAGNEATDCCITANPLGPESLFITGTSGTPGNIAGIAPTTIS